VTLAATRVRPGATAMSWLYSRIVAVQANDPLAPVTVIVPNNYVGLGLRRALAQRGYANVRFTVADRLAEAVGASALAERGWSPLTPILEDALVRAAIRSTSGFGAAGQHHGLIDTLRTLFGTLREREPAPADLAAWATRGRMAAAAIAAFGVFERSVQERGLYDERRRLDLAATALVTAPTDPLRELGAVIAYLPERLSPAVIRFLAALAARVPVEIALGWCGDALADEDSRANATALGIDIEATDVVAAPAAPADRRALIAPDAAEETRAVVRQIYADLRSGVPLHRVAVLYRSREPYAALVRNQLDAAALPWAALEGRPLTDSTVARGLLDLLRLPDGDFTRLDVLEWRSTLPHAGHEDPSLAEWNTLSREAGVVRGADQWRDRLDRLAQELRDVVGHGGREMSDAARAFRERRSTRAQLVANRVAAIVAAVAPPADRSWTGYVTWALDLRRRFVPPHPEADEQQAADLLDTALTDLASAAPFDTDIDLPVFLHALEAALSARRRPQGRLGAGVVVGSLAAARGLSFDRVYVVGMVEGAFPSRPAPDPTFPDSDPLEAHRRRGAAERAEFMSALAAADGGVVRLSAPAWDADLRPVYAAPWLLEAVDELEGRPVTAAELRSAATRGRITRLVSPDQALDLLPEPVNLAERRVREARLWRRRGALDRSAIARREDLALRRALELQAARASNIFTEFDGNVGGIAASSQRLRSGIAAIPISSSAIERWCTCPFHYFLDRVIRVEATDRPEDDENWSIDPAVRGSLVHDILETFFRELRQAGRPTRGEIYGASDHERIEEIAARAFAALEERGRTGYALAWENQRAAIVRDLHSVLGVDEARRLETKVVPMYFEQDFGMGSADSWPAPEVALPDGTTTRLRGRIDRVDLGPDPAQPTSAVVLDYKTGWVDRKALDLDPVDAGRKVQLAAYSLAARDHLRSLGAAEPQIRAAYWQVVAKYSFRFTEQPLDGTLEDRLREVLAAVHAGVVGGAFPQVPGDETQRIDALTWESCAYCEFDRICPPERRQLWERKQGVATIHPRLLRGGPD
jgi:ATP-dependent helicase/nuclease subunit B